MDGRLDLNCFISEAERNGHYFRKARPRLLPSNQASSASVTDVDIEGKWKRIRSSHCVRSKTAALKYLTIFFCYLSYCNESHLTSA